MSSDLPDDDESGDDSAESDSDVDSTVGIDLIMDDFAGFSVTGDTGDTWLAWRTIPVPKAGLWAGGRGTASVALIGCCSNCGIVTIPLHAGHLA